MSTIDSPAVSFSEADDRTAAMHRAIEDWLEELTGLVEQARGSEEFQAWLDVQSRFHEYSYRNALLIKQQCSEATKVAGYRTWQEEFDRYVEEGEQAIWIWAPIIASRCPECENSQRYHDTSDCEYNETPPEEWSRGLVGFKPAPVFDVSQTGGEPLPELETEATGDAEELLPALLDGAHDLDLEVRVVDEVDWSYRDAKGVCRHLGDESRQPIVEAKARGSDADLAVTLIHEFAHAWLHVGVEEPAERARREVEAEAVAYVVGRHFGLDTSNSAFYLAAWQGEESAVIQHRLERISSTAGRLIELLEP